MLPSDLTIQMCFQVSDSLVQIAFSHLFVCAAGVFAILLLQQQTVICGRALHMREVARDNKGGTFSSSDISSMLMHLISSLGQSQVNTVIDQL